MRGSFSSRRVLALLFGILIAPPTSWACTACFGQSDSPLAAGMNWGIMSLLGFIVFVLGAVAAFFVFLGWRSAKLSPMQTAAEQAEFEGFPRPETPRDLSAPGQARLKGPLPRPNCRSARRPRGFALRSNRQ